MSTIPLLSRVPTLNSAMYAVRPILGSWLQKMQGNLGKTGTVFNGAYFHGSPQNESDQIFTHLQQIGANLSDAWATASILLQLMESEDQSFMREYLIVASPAAPCPKCGNTKPVTDPVVTIGNGMNSEQALQAHVAQRQKCGQCGSPAQLSQFVSTFQPPSRGPVEVLADNVCFGMKGSNWTQLSNSNVVVPINFTNNDFSHPSMTSNTRRVGIYVNLQPNAVQAAPPAMVQQQHQQQAFQPPAPHRNASFVNHASPPAPIQNNNSANQDALLLLQQEKNKLEHEKAKLEFQKKQAEIKELEMEREKKRQLQLQILEEEKRKKEIAARDSTDGKDFATVMAESIKKDLEKSGLKGVVPAHYYVAIQDTATIPAVLEKSLENFVITKTSVKELKSKISQLHNQMQLAWIFISKNMPLFSTQPQVRDMFMIAGLQSGRLIDTIAEMRYSKIGPAKSYMGSEKLKAICQKLKELLPTIEFESFANTVIKQTIDTNATGSFSESFGGSLSAENGMTMNAVTASGSANGLGGVTATKVNSLGAAPMQPNPFGTMPMQLMQTLPTATPMPMPMQTNVHMAMMTPGPMGAPMSMPNMQMPMQTNQVMQQNMMMPLQQGMMNMQMQPQQPMMAASSPNLLQTFTPMQNQLSSSPSSLSLNSSGLLNGSPVASRLSLGASSLGGSPLGSSQSLQLGTGSRLSANLSSPSLGGGILGGGGLMMTQESDPQPMAPSMM